MLCLGLGLLIASCAGDAGPGTQRQAEPKRNDPAGGDAAENDTRRPLRWHQPRSVQGGLVVDVYFATSPYYEVVEAKAERSDDQLVLTLLARVPRAVTTREIGFRCNRVILDSPIGRRKLVDGAKDEPAAIPTEPVPDPQALECLESIRVADGTRGG